MINNYFPSIFMRLYKYVFLLCCAVGFCQILSAQDAVLMGVVKDQEGQPIVEVAIQEIGQGNGVYSDSSGKYILRLIGKEKAGIRVKVLGYELNSFNIHFHGGDTLHKDILMRRFANTLPDVKVRDQNFRNEAGDIKLDMKNIDRLPSTVGGVEGLLKILVGSHNELTSQYTVRGGNYDENLVYVNGFEIYRPFLIHSGQQEGLSFVNPDLVQSVNFSVGGFQAKYGDKMSSVLDVTYKKPTHFAGSVLLNLLGAKAHLEGASRDKKFTYLVGVRQKSNKYLLQSQPTKGEYTPSFSDFQALLRYQFNKKWSTEVIGNYARNRFDFIPEEQTAAFGYINKAYELHTFYNGQEQDQFDTYFGGAAINFVPNGKVTLKLQASAFQTNEFQTSDIYGEYGLFEVESDLGKTDFGQVKASLGSGAVHNFIRDYLTANVFQVKHTGTFKAKSQFFQWGLDFKKVRVNDQMLEWERRDSAGFSLPNSDTVINFTRNIHTDNLLSYYQTSAYLQDNVLLTRAYNMTLNVGLRATYSFLNEELILSPRIQYAFTPQWKQDIVFRFATGMYAQPPFYKEMRDLNGQLHTDLKAQKSWHIAGGFDYNFQMWGDRPFKLTSEVFYKFLWDLVPYEYDNVSVRYYANNNGRGYAYGGELRLYGDIVEGTPSWVSLGLLKTSNQFLNQTTGEFGTMMPRPTDQRVNVGMFFSDYLPRNKNFKMYLNAIYSSGLPFSPPGKATDPAFRSLRLPDYKRVDIGFSSLLLDGQNKKLHAYSLFNGFNSIWLSLEVFNLLGIRNTISYQWIKDFTTENTFAVPNRLTGRLLNVKLEFKF